MPPPLLPCLQRWGSAAFGEYVAGLERLADEALQAAIPQER